MTPSASLHHLKLRYWQWLAEFFDTEVGARRALLPQMLHPHVAWHVSKPIDACAGIDTVANRFWGPLFDACPDIERRDDIFVGGTFGEGSWVASTGHYVGTFVGPWLGLPPTGGAISIRFGEFVRFADDRIDQAYVLLDVLDVLRQAGRWPLPPSLGATDHVPGPMTHDGLVITPQDSAESHHSLQLVEAMISGLMDYDGATLESMGMQRFWHPQMMWYGPAGIGTTRGLAGFQQHHQRPFLQAFPDRRGGNHKARFADGVYVASTGWPSIQATHVGDGWLGVKSTGTRVTMRVMDFWRRDRSALRENWVFIDLIDLLGQMNVDVLAQAGITGTRS